MSWRPKQHIVAPYDFSDRSRAALDEALQLTEDASRVDVIHVLPRLSPMEPGVVWGEIDDASRRAHALAAMREKLSDPRYRDLNFTIAFGDPAREITKAAERTGADLIVISSHGRTGAKHILIGSVAERVVRHAHCPVLVLRA